ncbi:hypothetical protein [Desulfovibrio sp. JC010]|uniref:hypothetical protein n=1 Tax=Desulfovibrio sp. JC010 TaxID=2593641 RepID=UPI0013D4DA1C|nr:hypothetical protein [Desulfovibrio sp. JC010]NDV28806.1 hypothetical protein [Desulfovibrio sp. JC010]
MSLRKYSCPLLIFMLIMFCSTPAFAHRVNLFAYVEGDTVFTESYFSKKRKVHQGELEVFSTGNGELLLKGTTDNKGLFNFPIPEATKAEKSGLLINLYASEGHRATWTLHADEIFPETPQTASNTAAKTVHASSTVQTSPADKASSADLAELTAQVKTLTDKVETLKRLIISQQEKGPGVNEIFSGIGYILGLFGVAAFFLSRKK